eukprot:g2888.t1
MANKLLLFNPYFLQAEEEEPVDPKIAIVEECKSHGEAAQKWAEYMACAKRVQEKGYGECTPQYFEYFHALDHCVVPKLFKKLK